MEQHHFASCCGDGKWFFRTSAHVSSIRRHFERAWKYLWRAIKLSRHRGESFGAHDEHHFEHRGDLG